MSGLVKRENKLSCLLENLSTIRVRQKASKRASRCESISSGRLKGLENEAILLVALSYGSRVSAATPAEQILNPAPSTAAYAYLPCDAGRIIYWFGSSGGGVADVEYLTWLLHS